MQDNRVRKQENQTHPSRERDEGAGSFILSGQVDPRGQLASVHMKSLIYFYFIFETLPLKCKKNSE
jgi:hypothetical protein